LARSFDKHIDDIELEALVPSTSKTEGGLPGLSPQNVREAERHVASCAECSSKVSKYRQVIELFSNVGVLDVTPRRADCPKDEDVDWHEVAAGLWPEFKARQLILHAALCDHCGPLLRAATSLEPEPTPEEEKLLEELKAPSVPGGATRLAHPQQPRWQFTRWLVPALSIIVIVGVLSTIRPWSSMPLTGQKFAELAVKAHKQHAQGNLALDVRSDSQETLNEWLKEKSPFSLALPASPAVPDEKRPYRLEGARLLPVAGKTAAYIAYEVQASPASLMVVPDSVAVSSGGVEADFTKVSFHYRMVEGYKVVTWSVHGLTYALVSQEGNGTQRSCMVCHSAMRDRDLSKTPTPLRSYMNATEPVRD
jgi:anti-sigma factor RsiW